MLEWFRGVWSCVWSLTVWSQRLSGTVTRRATMSMTRLYSLLDCHDLSRPGFALGVGMVVKLLVRMQKQMRACQECESLLWACRRLHLQSVKWPWFVQSRELRRYLQRDEGCNVE